MGPRTFLNYLTLLKAAKDKNCLNDNLIAELLRFIKYQMKRFAGRESLFTSHDKETIEENTTLVCTFDMSFILECQQKEVIIIFIL